jgi:protease-4
LLVGGLTLMSLVLALAVSGGGGTGRSARKDGPRIGVVEISGVIQGSKQALEHLVDFRDDESIAAIVVRISSPGGAVGPSQEIYREIVKTKAKKKVVASFGNVAASGGYYIGSAADQIFASEGTLTGSIGVISTLANFSELMALARVNVEIIKSGAYKDSGSPFRKMTPEDRAVHEALVADVHNQFVADVARGRKLPEPEVRAAADGRVMTGRRAKELKLVDEIGNLRDAAARAAQLAQAKAGEPVLVYPKPKDRSLVQSLLHDGARSLASEVAGELLQALRTAGTSATVEARDPQLPAGP